MEKVALVELGKVAEDRGVDPRVWRAVVALLRGKRRSVRDLFTNELHYEAFKNVRFNVDALWLSRSYALVALAQTVKPRGPYSRPRTYSHYYVLGVNSDGRLFINKVEGRFPPEEALDAPLCLVCDGGRRALVYFVEDSDVYQVMGYDFDMEASPAKALPLSTGGHRLQGDVVLTVNLTGEDAWSAYSNDMVFALRRDVEAVIEREVAARISLLLAEKGISSTLRGGELSIPAPVEGGKEALEKVAKLIADELYVEDVARRSVEADIYVDYERRVYFLDRETKAAPLLVRVRFSGQRPFGERFGEITVRCYGDGAASWYAEEIWSQVRPRAEPRARLMGRHRVEYVAYPSVINLTWEAPFNTVLGERAFVLTASSPQVLFEEGTLRVTHPEHGVAEYAVREKMYGEFAGVAVRRDFVDRLSVYALRRL